MTYTKKHAGGRPATFPNTEDGLNRFKNEIRQYRDSLPDAGRQFSKLGLAEYLNITRPTLYKIIGRSGQWAEAVVVE